MTISTIRKLTTDDETRVNVAAERFCVRHGITFDEGFAEDEIEYATQSEHGDNGRAAYLRKLWAAVYCRALRVPCDARTTIAYGYVGISVS